MGHVIAAGFSQESLTELKFLMKKATSDSANKIPYGRGCDREQADSVFGYHISLFNWAKEKDGTMLGRLCGYQFRSACTVFAEKPILLHGHEDSVMLCLKIRPADGFYSLTDGLKDTLGHKVGEHPHITLAVSKDHGRIHRMYKKLKKSEFFPLELTVDHLELYKVWNPVELVREYR
ncbi:hypothetical protein SAMN02910447_01730 [Ruminococcus sp. YE71]|uniref:hypothetical protein n=1 Tax=unclassified Ruminococcus TaxID=2608920 RepID=UPI000888B187|nr:MULTISPECIES: hypothetical protein [unclassified Ruminococcus]SDA20267.1 hypothetical protein SAMN02910446_01731 [Ruminococcus sp. YE78]SFW32155.1 hypothetical protein SAMN02910447_01730 [Ruminococcus sp. YE71]